MVHCLAAQYPNDKLASMNQSRSSKIVIVTVSVVIVIAAVALGWYIFQGDTRLLRDAAIDESSISPNADGEQDLQVEMVAPSGEYSICCTGPEWISSNWTTISARPRS